MILKVNLFPTHNDTFDHVARTDETAVAAGDLIESIELPAAASTYALDLHGILLAKGQYIQFDVEGTTPIVGVSMWGHWEREAV